MKPSQLSETEFAPFYKNYIALANEADLVEELEISVHEFIKFVQNIPMDKFDYRYTECENLFIEMLTRLT